MMKLFKKSILCLGLISFGFLMSSCSQPAKHVNATTPPSAKWQSQEVLTDSNYKVYVITDPDTQIQYILVRDSTMKGGVAMTITPRLLDLPK